MRTRENGLVKYLLLCKVVLHRNNCVILRIKYLIYSRRLPEVELALAFLILNSHRQDVCHGTICPVAAHEPLTAKIYLC